MDDKRPQSGEVAATVCPRWPLNPITLPDDEASPDLAMDTTVFRLLDFPTEIVTKIFESLVPAPLPTGIELALLTDILTSREALVNLSKTSKFCNEIAMPLVYRNIIITNRMQLAKLFANLIAHQERCAWMRSVAVLVDLAFQGNFKEDGQAAFALYESSLGIHKVRNQPRALVEAVDDMTWCIYTSSDDLTEWVNEWICEDPFSSWRPRWFYLQLLRITLYLGNRIEDLLITAPDDHDCLDDEYYRRTCLGDLEDIAPGQITAANTDPAVVGDIFKALRRIRTQSDPRDDGNFVPQPLALEFTKSREWEFRHDNGCWMSIVDSGRIHPPGPYKHLDVFSHVTELSLLDSKTHPAWLRCCFRYAKNLEKLTYTTSAAAWNDDFAWHVLTSEEYHATLQQALEEVRDTLTDLRLGWAPWGAVLTEEAQAAVAPHRVDVSHFPRLKRVDIDVPFVYEDDIDYEDDDNDQNHHTES